MKRFCSLILLAAVAATLFCGLTAVAADESGQVQYQVTAPLDVYVENGSGYIKAFSVPVSYYVFAIGASEGGYTQISYGNLTDAPFFYVKTAELKTNAKIDDYDLSEKDAAKMGAYLPVSDLALRDGSHTIYNLYDQEEPISASLCRIVQFFGVCSVTAGATIPSGTYYFVTLEQSRGGNVADTFEAFVPATSTTHPALTVEDAPIHHEDTVVDTPDAPVIDDADGTAAPAQEGNVVRGIMIALICVLCVAVIFLIFKPTKNRKDRYDL